MINVLNTWSRLQNRIRNRSLLVGFHRKNQENPSIIYIYIYRERERVCVCERLLVLGEPSKNYANILIRVTLLECSY